MTGLLVAACALLGLAVGSFLNVVVHRLPRRESVVSPRSRCPGCGNPVAARDNIPVLSWLLLRGRCRRCRTAISARYPLLELATAALFGVLALRLGPDAALPAFLYLGAVGLALALIDLEVKRLPDALTLPSYPVGIALLGVAVLLGADGGWGALARALAGMAAYYAAYFLLVLAYPAGMGFGDVKLAGVLGLFTGWLGWGSWAVAFAGGFLLGGVWAVGLLLVRRAGRRTAIPYGPFMLAGALVAVVAGEPLATAYLELALGI